MTLRVFKRIGEQIRGLLDFVIDCFGLLVLLVLIFPLGFIEMIDDIRARKRNNKTL